MMQRAADQDLKIMIVDDSVVFRSQIKSVLSKEDGLHVECVAANGKIAIQKLQQNAEIDVAIMDLEMPEMDGVQAINRIRELDLDVKVIVFSSMTASSAKLTLQALEGGALDFVTKPSGNFSGLEESLEKIKEQLIPKINQIRRYSSYSSVGANKSKARVEKRSLDSAKEKPVEPGYLDTQAKLRLQTMVCDLLVIASSTGGPVALEKVFAILSKTKISVPIIIAQHMPPIFTKSLAQKLASISGLDVVEARNGELVSEKKIYIAPGNYHLKLGLDDDNQARIFTNQGPKRNSIRPAADFLFESAAEIYNKSLLGIVLTGMGQDGMDGAAAIKQAGGNIVIQDKESSAVWGMPGAVYHSGDYDGVFTLERIANLIIEKCGKV